MPIEIKMALGLITLAIGSWLTCKVMQWKWDRDIRKEKYGIADRI